MSTNHFKHLNDLFHNLYNADTEVEVDNILESLDWNFSWRPYGDNKGNFGVIENQQASAIPAIVEKITNSIDAILMRHCYEKGIDPKSPTAPKSVDKAISTFFLNSENWDLTSERSKQAESIQIIASGPRKNTSLVIYDDGEGQHPENFPDTFLSLLTRNKNEIPFVQGKYNMGGSGAIVFCGKNRYQLIASKRYDKTGLFGFTLLRKHPLSEKDEQTYKCTWYEYLLYKENIPSFSINSLDLGLYNREFVTGSIIKLYSYELPPGSRSVISRDLNQSINEYLFEPALPLYTIDTEDRFPKDVNLQRSLYGLKRRLDNVGDTYIKEKFSETFQDSDGTIKINVYVFKSRLDGKKIKETKSTIKREFFKNNMAVMFSVNGQVHGHYNTEFITKRLKFNLLKDYVLIHVDCTDLNIRFRNELFMASRDRMKNGLEAKKLRDTIADILTKSRLNQINKEWRDSVSFATDNADDILKNFSKDLPISYDFRKLISNTIASDLKNKTKADQSSNKNKNRKINKNPFNPQRYPSTFKIDLKARNNDDLPITKIPLNGDKNLYFSTNVEDQFFDRIDDPGDLKITVLSSSTNNEIGGNNPGLPNEPDELIDVSISSPSKGKIRVNINPTDLVEIGHEIKCKASLSSGVGESLDQVFIIQIADKENKPKKIKEPKNPEENLGLPELKLVYERDWEKLEENGIEMGWENIMFPLVEGDKLDKIFINMDSTTLKKYKTKFNTQEQFKLADNRYISAVYFHTLFLYSISKNQKYQFSSQKDERIELTQYLTEIFDNSYSEFLLKFEIEALIEILDE